MRDISVLLAVSGGSDSVALLHVFLSLREKLDLRLGIVHVNYALRGEDSDLDERLVREYADRYGLPCFIYRPRSAKGKSEAVLRDMRYRFFERVADREGYDVVAIAHTQDDQAETILIRLFRGTGPEGLAGMRPRRDRYIRPLLGRTKAELIRLLEAEQLPFREDVSNRDMGILRNRIRHELIPLLEREYRQGVRKTLARAAEHCSGIGIEDVSTLISLVSEDGRFMFSRSEFLALSKRNRTIVLRDMFRRLSGTGYGPTSSFVMEASKLLESRMKKAQRLVSGRLIIEARGDRVDMIRCL